MSILDSLSSLTFDQYGPVFLLFAILSIFLLACVIHSIRQKAIRSEEQLFDNPQSMPVQKSIVITDGNTGEQRAVAEA